MKDRASPSSGRAWTWIAILLVFLVCALFLGLHATEKTALGRAETYLDTMRSARLFLAKGFLQLSLDGEPNSPYDRAAGLALLEQALQIFEEAVTKSAFLEGEEAAKEIESFVRRLRALEQELLRYREGARYAGDETALRLGLFELERRAERLDLLGREETRVLSARLDGLFIVTAAGSACLLFSVCLIVLRSFKQAESARTGLAEALERSESLARSLSERDEVIRRDLDEKVVLLQEIHHRVKNNLQIVSSLLSLEARTMRDSADAEALTRSQNRVHAMALVHELLHESSSLSSIDAAEYLRRFVRKLGEVYGGGDLEGLFELDPFPLSLDKATCFGLLLHEAISNAYKHGTKEGAEPWIRISLRLEGGFAHLEVADDGPGFRPGFDPLASESLGLSLQRNLAQQLGGEPSWLPREGGGIVFKLSFPAT